MVCNEFIEFLFPFSIPTQNSTCHAQINVPVELVKLLYYMIRNIKSTCISYIVYFIHLVDHCHFSKVSSIQKTL